VDTTRRPNECPRCGFAYNAWNRPKPATFTERFKRNLQERARHGFGTTGEIRYAQAEQVRPFQCRCGTWLRARPWSFGWADVVGIVVIAAIQVVVAVKVPWARNKWFFAIPIGLWVGYRTTTQVAIDELPASEIPPPATNA